MVRKLKAWLKKNYLTPEKNDFTAVIESFGSINPDGIVDELAADGMELKPETVRDVISRYNRKCIDLTLRGYNVNTGIVYMHATIKGVFYDKTWNPEHHRLHVAISQGTDLRAAVAETTVEIMGEHPDPIALFTITDLSTGKTDGSITRGFNAELKGTYIKIAGEDESCGIYFHNIDTLEDTKLEPQYIAVNDPSRILFITPSTLADGTYELSVITQFTGANKTLKHPRSVSLGYQVTIG
jgi:hypothetical protein